jgi:hypothetical protein
MANMIQDTRKQETTIKDILEAVYEAILLVDMVVSLLNKDPKETYFSDAIIYLKHMKNFASSVSATFVIATKVAVWADEKGTKEYLNNLIK